MSHRKSTPLSALLGLALAGCLGGESEAPPPEAKIRPGAYEGDYSYIPDSLRQQFDAQMVLFPNGTYRSIWEKDSEAVYDEQGAWSQQGQSLFLRNSTENWLDNYGVFSKTEPIEDDTCALARITDTSFVRNEWIPAILRKRQWTNYRLRNIPKLSDGTYTFVATVDSIPRRYRITLSGDSYRYSESDTAEIYQAEARFTQVGTFLALEENRWRWRDSTGTAWNDWDQESGHYIQRMRAVSDTAFDIRMPGNFLVRPEWHHYRRDPG